MSYKTEQLPDSYTFLGEGPHWDIATQSLYYVDIVAVKLFRYDYRENKVYHCKIAGEKFVTFIIPIEGEKDKFVVGCGPRVLVVAWNGTAEACTVERTLFEMERDDQYNSKRFNDAKCDSYGRLVTGSMAAVGDIWNFRSGHVYKYEEGGKVDILRGDVGMSNGLAFNENAGKFYYVDSNVFEVKEYDYDCQKGLISNPKVVYDFRRPSPEANLIPDGMTIDADGNIYVVCFNSNTIFKICPRTGKLLMEIKMPCKQITSAAFGGPDLDILFVTSCGKFENFEEPPPGGSIFKVTGLGAKGLPMTKLKV